MVFSKGIDIDEALTLCSITDDIQRAMSGEGTGRTTCVLSDLGGGATADRAYTRSYLAESFALSESKQTLLQYLRKRGGPMVCFVQNIAAQREIRHPGFEKPLPLRSLTPEDFAGL